MFKNNDVKDSQITFNHNFDFKKRIATKNQSQLVKTCQTKANSSSNEHCSPFAGGQGRFGRRQQCREDEHCPSALHEPVR